MDESAMSLAAKSTSLTRAERTSVLGAAPEIVAATHNQLTDEQRQVLQEIPEWRRMRGNRLGDMFRDAVERILGGEDEAWTREFAQKQFPEWTGSPPEYSSW
jgi:hypothetical protein